MVSQFNLNKRRTEESWAWAWKRFQRFLFSELGPGALSLSNSPRVNESSRSSSPRIQTLFTEKDLWRSPGEGRGVGRPPSEREESFGLALYCRVY